MLAFFCVLIGKGWHWARDGFSLRRIQFPLMKAMESAPLSDELNAMLEQPFFYLGRGHQSFAFLSKDQKYVLKLPRYDIYRMPFWMRSLPFLKEVRFTYLQEKKRRFSFLMNSFILANQEMKEETGLLFLHLNVTKNLKKTVSLVDPVGRRFEMDLDRSGFLLQKRCDLLIPLYLEAKREGDEEKRKEILKAVLTFHEERARKGIHNKDPSFMRNIAFVEGHVVQIDVGSFYRQESQDFRTSFSKHAGHFRDFLKEEDPEMESWFSEQIEEICQK